LYCGGGSCGGGKDLRRCDQRLTPQRRVIQGLLPKSDGGRNERRCSNRGDNKHNQLALQTRANLHGAFFRSETNERQFKLPTDKQG
jgi:hypothetical protein